MPTIDPTTFPKAPEDFDEKGKQQITLAGGCFWCTEGVFEKLPGVTDVTSGYIGGDAATANYDAVCSGRTGHAEAIRVTYDADRISLGTILRVFFAVAHDPTQLNRQGNDVGTQYRSAAFPTSDDQRRVIKRYIQAIDDSGVLPGPIATTIEPAGAFIEAEAYHQDFMQKNPAQPYACAVGLPKVRKLEAWLATSPELK
jgi:peptide-methionine (S)-S-oxide reductase